MAQSTLNPQAMARNAQAISPSLWLLAFATLLIAGGAVLVADRAVGLVMISVAGTLGCLVLIIYLLALRARREVARSHAMFDSVAGQDAAPCFTTDEDGAIGYQNRAAVERFGMEPGVPLIRALGDLFANPSAVLFRLQNKAMATGAAREDVVTRRGHVRLSVHRIAGQRFFWRLEELVDRNATARGAETLGLPMLTASKSDTVLFMNEAMRRLVGGRVRTLDRIFPYLPLRTGEEVTVTVQEGSARAIVAELEGAGGRREIYLLPATSERQGGGPAFAGFEDLPVALLRLSPEGAVEQANRFARELLGLGSAAPSPTEAGRASEDATAVADFGLDLAHLLEGLGRPLGDWLVDAMAGRAAQHTETLRAVRRPGDIFLRVTLRRVVEAGRPSLVAVLQDMTEYKTLEAQFVQSQKMQAIGQLAGGIAHDFNNLLTAISGHCDLLLLRHDRDDPDYGDLVQIHQNANRAASLVGQLLAFSRKQRLSPEILDIHDVLSDLTHLLDRLVGETVTLDLQEAEDLPCIRADKRQLEQVIMNLVVNACDAMPSGGRITMRTRGVALREPVARGRAVVPVGDYVVIEVEDEGSGIAPEIADKIFEPFFTTKGAGKGTGLGLSMAYGIVKQTGGFIFVDSSATTGTLFTLYFKAERGRPDAPAPDGPAPGRGGASDLPAGEAEGEPPVCAATDPASFEPTAGLVRDAARPALSLPAARGAPPRADKPDGRIPDSGRETASHTCDVDPAADTAAEAATPLGKAPGSRPEQQEGAPTDTIMGAPADPGQERDASAAYGFATTRTSALTEAAKAPGTPAPSGPGGLEASISAILGDRNEKDSVILLVEDEAPVRAFAARALKLQGYTVLEAENAESALAQLADPEVRVDLFLTDVVMPGMDGPTWVRQARGARPDVRVIFMSGYADGAPGGDGAIPADAVLLPKPFSLEELASTVRAQLH